MKHRGRPGRGEGYEESQKTGLERSKPFLRGQMVSFKLSNGWACIIAPTPDSSVDSVLLADLT